MVRVLDRNAQLLEREDGIAPQIARVIERSKIEVAAGVEHFESFAVLEIVVLDLGAHVHHIAELLSARHHFGEHRARITIVDAAFRGADRTEHTRDRVLSRTPGQDLEGGRIGKCEHIGFVIQRKALHTACIEAHALFKGVFELARNNSERLHIAEHIAEPEAHEMNVPALDGLQYEILIGAHCHAWSSFP